MPQPAEVARRNLGMRFERKKPWYQSRIETTEREDYATQGCALVPELGCLALILVVPLYTIALVIRSIRRAFGEMDPPL